MITAAVLFDQANVIRDREPWRRAYSYSIFGHGALLVLFLFTTIQQKAITKTILREVRYIDLTATAVAKVESAGDDSGKRIARGGGVAVETGATGNPNGHSAKNLPEQRISSPRGDAGGEGVLSEPIAGPIVSINELGDVGTKKATIRELAGRTSSNGSGSGVTLPAGPAAKTGPKIALARADLEKIKSQEGRLGVPLVSEGVLSGGLEGRSKALASSGLGEKKKAAYSDLRANPMDMDKWGKSDGLFSMEGPLKYRKILKMELPAYPRWAEEQALETAVSIRLWVDPAGKPRDNMYMEKTSGYAELDQLALDALKRFVFVRLPDNQSQEDEWGVATFRFKLKK